MNERHYWDAHWEHPNIGILFVVFRRNGLHYIRRAGSGWTEKDCRGPFESLNEAINLAEALAILEGKTP